MVGRKILKKAVSNEKMYSIRRYMRRDVQRERNLQKRYLWRV
jgi:hypothetical protein